ncbi:hypothetical protein C4S77_02775 [Apibacter adventoris]|uniref:Uncharacterized protein n=2 Tax=Apibacter adventoris TaxID=1679466 RepID=A0A2S8AFE9_9FLAO|nr:hypothetical protein C4S77_02775 [Apibacter adventoris]
MLECSINKPLVRYYNTTLEKEKKLKFKYTHFLEKMYKESLPEKYQPEKIKNYNIRLLIVNGAAFKGEFIVINKKDTLKYIGDSAGYCKTRLYELPAGLKKMNIEDSKRGKYIIKLKKEYDYIEISGFKDTLIIRYLDFPKLRLCT